MLKIKNKGFTLIELLVVVAIIGILASVVLASLNTARQKGADAKIKAQLSNMRGQAQLYSGTGTAFATATPCVLGANTLFEKSTTTNGLGILFDGITLATTRCGSAAGLPETGAAWAVAATLSTGGAFCVDWLGTARDETAAGVKYTSLATAITTTSCL